MSTIDIHTLYSPLNLQTSNEELGYDQCRPDPRLSPYIGYYWNMTTLCPHTNPVMFTGMADGCIDIIISIRRPEQIVGLVSGITNEYTEFPMDKDFVCFGIRFLPAGFTALTSISASLLTGEVYTIEDVLPDLWSYINSRISFDTTFAAFVLLFDSYFLDRVNFYDVRSDRRVCAVLGELLTKLNLGDVAESSLCSRHIRRLFEEYVGDTPKVLERIVRFQQYIRLVNAMPTDRTAYFDCGFYDQSHLIKDFHRLAGTTPKKFFHSK